MKLFHGSTHVVSTLKPSADTGIIRESEEDRVGYRNVLFYSTDFNLALLYAKKTGVVYEVEVENPTQYKQHMMNNPTSNIQRKKAPHIDDSIYITDDCKIIAIWHLQPRKKNEKQKYMREVI